MWFGSAGSLSLLVREGQDAPGAPEGVKFGSPKGNDDAFWAGSVNAREQIAIVGQVTGGGLLDSGNDGLYGIWAYDPLLGMQLVALEGMPIEVTPGDLRTVAFVSLNGGMAERALNDSGQLAFYASFTDGSEAILVAWAPEPKGAMLALIGLGLCGLRGRSNKPDTGESNSLEPTPVGSVPLRCEQCSKQSRGQTGPSVVTWE